MSIVLSSLDPVDQDSPSFADLDIETLHKQLLEAATPTAQPAVEISGDGFQSGSYIDVGGFDRRKSVVNSIEQAHSTDRLMRLLTENTGWPELDRFTFRTKAFTTVRVDYPFGATLGSVPPGHDADFAFVRPQAVEYRPAIPADYTTAIPSIYSHVDEPIATLQNGRYEIPSDAMVSRTAHGTPPTRRVAPLPRRATSLASHPRTPPLRAVDRNVSEDHMCATQKRKAQASYPRASKKVKEATLASPSPHHSGRETRASSTRDVGEYVCPAEGCSKICRRIGDLNRHLQSRAHQLPSFSCPAGCGKVFSRKDAAKRHSETEKCPMFELA